MPHILVIGGTGMLREAVLYYTRHGCTVSVIARKQPAFNKLIEVKDQYGFINPVRVDYTDINLLREKIISAIESFGLIDECVSWIHSTASETPHAIAEILNRQNIPVKFFHVLGSEYLNPETLKEDYSQTFSLYKNIMYKKIILGFVISGDRSRWLTNPEIGNGVIDALTSGKDIFVVGKVDPWESRP